MTPVTETLSASPGTGSSPFLVDTTLTPAALSIGVVVAGAATYSIQHTYDELDAVGVEATWFNHPALSNITSSAAGNYAYPVYAVRLYFISGSGTVSATFIQTGPYWENVDDGQDPNWAPLDDGQNPNWTLVEDSQNPDWV